MLNNYVNSQNINMLLELGSMMRRQVKLKNNKKAKSKSHGQFYK